MSRNKTIAAVLVLIVVVGGIGYLAGSHGTPTVTDTSSGTTTPQETLSASDAPPAVQDSLPGAKELAQNMSASGYNDVRTFINPRTGDITIVYKSDATRGTELKDELKDAALMYSEVMGEYPETGELAIQANGIEMLVSSDTALAHDKGKINEEAFFNTLHFDTVETNDDSG